MFLLIKKSFLEKKWLFWSLLAFAVFFIWMYVSVFKTVSIVSSVGELVKIMPEKIVKSFNIDIGVLNTFEGFIGNEKFSFLLTLLISILAISLGGSYLSGEIEKGTITLPLSLPIKRRAFYLAKLLSGSIIIITFSTLAIMSIFPLTAYYQVTIAGERFIRLAIFSGLFGLTIFSLSLFLSSISSDKSKVAFLTSGVLLLTYVLFTISKISNKFENLKYLSLLHYFNIVDLMVKNKPNTSGYLVFIALFLIFSLGGLLWFQRRGIETSD